MKQLQRILLVDDDEVTNFINAENLTTLGVAEHIDICGNGREAIEYLIALLGKGESLPNLIFLDINMPEMNGFAFLEALTHLNHPEIDEVVIIILSTSLRKEDIESAQRFGDVVSDYIEKPLTGETVIELIERYF